MYNITIPLFQRHFHRASLKTGCSRLYIITSSFLLKNNVATPKSELTLVPPTSGNHGPFSSKKSRAGPRNLIQSTLREEEVRRKAKLKVRESQQSLDLSTTFHSDVPCTPHNVHCWPYLPNVRSTRIHSTETGSMRRTTS